MANRMAKNPVATHRSSLKSAVETLTQLVRASKRDVRMRLHRAIPGRVYFISSFIGQEQGL